MCDKRDRAITYVFCRDLQLTLVFSGLLQKDLFKGKWSLAKSFFKQNYCHVCHTSFALFFPLPSCSLLIMTFRMRQEWKTSLWNNARVLAQAMANHLRSMQRMRWLKGLLRMLRKVLDDAPHVHMENSLITFAGSCFHFVLLCLTCFIGVVICPIDSKN